MHAVYGKVFYTMTNRVGLAFSLESVNSFWITVFCLCPLFFYMVQCAGMKKRIIAQGDPRGCKRLGKPAGAHIEDEFNSRHTEGQLQKRGSRGPVVGRVESLLIHPIKSCRGVEVSKARVLKTGLEYDRQFTFAEYQEEDQRWQFVTQRKYGRLATIKAEIWIPDPLSTTFSTGEAYIESGGALVIKYPSAEGNLGKKRAKIAIQIPYNPTKAQIHTFGYKVEKMQVWKDSTQSLMIASTASSNSPFWIKDIQSYLGSSKPFALFRVADGHDRLVFRNAPTERQLGYQSVVGFADAYPLHILGLASVQDLRNRLPAGVPALTALQFRANIYMSGPKAYAEDSWKRIRIGQEDYHTVCRTTRCQLPNTDQVTGNKHLSEPSKTMKTYRNIDDGAGPNQACLGMQMVPAAEQGIIAVGDTIEVLETGSHFYILQ